MQRMTSALLLVTVTAILASANSKAAEWPNFRGPRHTGVAPEASPPTEWGEGKNVAWKIELEGTGHASPVVWGDKIFVLSAVKTDKQGAASTSRAADEPVVMPAQRRRPERVAPTHVHQFVVSAFGTKDGKRIWRTVVREEVPHESLHSTASQASASPVTDGKHVWAFFGSRGLFCLDVDGKVIWEKQLGTQTTRNEFGEGASPVVHGDTILINWDHEGESFLLALDKKSGKERWRKQRDEPTSWSTPLMVRDGKRDLAIVSAAKAVRAYDIKTGDVVWSASGLGLNVVPTPVADDDTVWVMSGWREAYGMAIRYPGAKGDITETERIRWGTDRGLSYVPSAVLVDGKLHFFQRFTGLLSCYDLDTGKGCYEQPQLRIDSFENIYASPVAAGNNIYAVSRDGEAVVFRAGSGYEVVARNELDDTFNATPAIVGDSIYLRGDRYLYRIKE